MRKLRHVVFAAKRKFGAAPEDTPAMRLAVGRYVRDYMAGDVEGSQLKMPPHSIARWEQFVVEAVMLPTWGYVAARVARNRGSAPLLRAAREAAEGDCSYFTAIFGGARPGVK
jgi:hypothetical protein